MEETPVGGIHKDLSCKQGKLLEETGTGMGIARIPDISETVLRTGRETGRILDRALVYLVLQRDLLSWH